MLNRIHTRVLMTSMGAVCLAAGFAALAQPRTYDVATGTAKTFASKWQPIPGYSPQLVLSVDRDQRIGGRLLRRGEEITFTIIPGTQFESGTIAPGQAVRVEYDAVEANLSGKPVAHAVRLVSASSTPQRISNLQRQDAPRSRGVIFVSDARLVRQGSLQ